MGQWGLEAGLGVGGHGGVARRVGSSVEGRGQLGRVGLWAGLTRVGVLQPFPFLSACRFVPSLRPLRQQALLLQFPPTLPSRLVQRLQEVCRTPVGGLQYCL